MDAAMLLDPDDLLTMPDGDNYELIDGVPVEKEMGTQSSKLAFNLASILHNFVRKHRLGEVFGTDTGFAAFPGHPKMFRKPDASFYRNGRLPDGIPVGLLKVAPDLVVESVSPTDKAEDLEAKVLLYRGAGVRLIWVLHPSTRTALVRRLNGTALEVGPDGNLDGEDVLPGFTCRIAELFE